MKSGSHPGPSFYNFTFYDGLSGGKSGPAQLANSSRVSGSIPIPGSYGTILTFFHGREYLSTLFVCVLQAHDANYLILNAN